MKNTLAGKAAIVTGAGSGLGKSMALLFAAEGARVVFADINEAAAQASAREAGQDGNAVRVDITDQASTEAMAARALELFGRIDVLGHCAGIAGPGMAHEVSLAEWNKVIAVDLTGTWLANRAVLPAMMAQKSGSIINIASLGGIRGVPMLASYAAAKAGVVGLTQQMAVDYAQYNIRVNAICPGTVFTDLVKETWIARGVWNEADPEASMKTMGANFTLRRLGQPDEISHLALYMASDMSGFMTGSAVPVDGGVSATAWQVPR